MLPFSPQLLLLRRRGHRAAWTPERPVARCLATAPLQPLQPRRDRSRTMKNIRIFLWVGLALILFVNYQTWVMDYTAKDAAAEGRCRARQPRPPARPIRWRQPCPRRQFRPSRDRSSHRRAVASPSAHGCAHRGAFGGTPSPAATAGASAAPTAPSHQRAHRCAGRGCEPARRRTAARRPAGLSGRKGPGRAGAPAAQQRRR